MAVVKSRDLARIAGALARAGAKWTPVFRKTRDANGMPTGAESRIGCILGTAYKKGTSSVLSIDVPGVILRTDVPRFEGVLAYNCTQIEKQDEICIAATRHEIMEVQAVDGMYYILTLKE